MFKTEQFVRLSIVAILVTLVTIAVIASKRDPCKGELAIDNLYDCLAKK